MVDRALLILQRRGRVSLRALQLDLDVDAGVAGALREELVEVLGVAQDLAPGVIELRVAPAGTDREGDGEPAPGGPERRQLTVMLCDLVSSTPLAEALDPEVLHAVMARYQAICNETIRRFEGHISQWIGDGVDVYFGYPRAHEDDAARAVGCGLEIIAALTEARRALLDEQGVELSVRVGISTGITVVGGTAQDSHRGTLAFGDTPNIAARVQALAAPNTVVVTDRTYRLLAGEFRFEPLGPQRLKGIVEPVELFRALGPAQTGRFTGAGSRGIAGLVDRDGERRALRRLGERVAAGESAAVLLRGEPGIGKSRLIAALREMALGELAYQVIDCHCSPLLRGSALYPITEGLSRFLGLGDADGESRLRAAAARESDAALLALALGVPVPEGPVALDSASPQRLRRETLQALAELFFAAARRAPLCLIVEDLHWVDPSTTELLGTLVAGRGDSRLLVLMSARPEFATPWESVPEILEVGRLPASATLELIQDAAGDDLSADTARRMAARADGIPLFAEELSRAAADRATAEDDIPTTLYGCLMARLDRDPAARSVAQLAAVVGREFEVPVLEATGELSPGLIDRGLARLIDDELVYRTAEDRCAFHHVLIADAARGSLLRDVRSRYHRRVADALAERFPEIAAQQPERVARHLEWAGAQIDAVVQWQNAGVAALMRSANVEASVSFDRALSLLEDAGDDPQVAPLELSLHVLASLPLVATRGWTAPEVLAHLERAEQLCEIVEGAPQLFPTMLGLVTYRLVSGQLHDAVALGGDQIAVARAAGDEELEMEALCEVGNALAYMARFQESRERLLRVGELYDPERHHHHTVLFGRDPGAIALVHLALGSLCVGEPERAREEVEAALALLHRWPHPFSSAWAHASAAHVHYLLGDTDRMAAEAGTAVTISRREGFPNWEAQGLVCQGWAQVVGGEVESGLAAARRGVAMWEMGGAVLMRPHLLGLLGDALRRAGEPEAAGEALDAALDWARRSDELWPLPQLHIHRARLARDRGRPSAQQEEAREAASIARRTGAIGFIASAEALLPEQPLGAGRLTAPA